jgi:aminopeptidase N
LPRPDVVLANDDDLTYCKLRLDPHSLDTIRTGGLAAIADPLARALCWTAAWDMLRDGEMATRHYLELAVLNGPGESEIGVLQSVHRQALRALETFADPAWAPIGRAQFADVAMAAALAAEPGSDHQLGWVHALTGAASTDEHAGFLAGLLSGQRQLPGLTVDTDLRWSLLQALVAGGWAGEPEIAAAAAADPSSAGVREAATARALLPTVEAKQRAWDAATSDVTLSNGLMRATIVGFTHPLQSELLAPYAQRYFDQAADIWRLRTPETAAELINKLFPKWGSAIEEETLRRADEFLADASQPAALRRLISEGRADVARCLAAREVDRAAARS